MDPVVHSGADPVMQSGMDPMDPLDPVNPNGPSESSKLSGPSGPRSVHMLAYWGRPRAVPGRTQGCPHGWTQAQSVYCGG